MSASKRTVRTPVVSVTESMVLPPETSSTSTVYRCGDCTLHVLIPEGAVALTMAGPESGRCIPGELAVATVLPAVSLIVVFTATVVPVGPATATEAWKVAPPPLVWLVNTHAPSCAM